MTSFNSQINRDGYEIQFETDNCAHYKRVQQVIRECIDEKPERRKIIALDYDGTIALNSYPQAGDPNWPVIEAAKAEMAAGSKLILWTCREGEELDIALAACAEWGLEFAAVNDNLPEMKEAWGNNPRKVFANEYWDDRAVMVSTDTGPAAALRWFALRSDFVCGDGCLNCGTDICDRCKGYRDFVEV